MKGTWAIGAAAFAVPAIVIGLVFGLTADSNSCGVGQIVSASSTSGTVAGYSGDQLDNAAAIVNAAAARGLSTQAQVIGVATAMGESSLRNIGYGDWETSGVTNPDGTPTTSIGLFQQQDSWGSREQRLDPTAAAGLFFDRLVHVEAWETLPVTIAAHRVQRNANANHYDKFEAPAREVVGALTGAGVTNAGAVCGDFPPATGNAPGPWGGYENGRIPASVLTSIPWQNNIVLRADATAALIAMNSAFKAEFGYDIPLNDGYRSYENQVKAKLEEGDNAAAPGTSTHGWAMAIDIADRRHMLIGFGNATYLWLKQNAGRYGWAHPDWAEPGGDGPDEAWHWEYYGTATAT